MEFLIIFYNIWLLLYLLWSRELVHGVEMELQDYYKISIITKI